MIDEPHIYFTDARHVVLDAPWSVVTRAGVLWVSVGAKSDGASIPAFLWAIAGSPYEGDTLPAAFAHDQVYGAQLTSRKTADEILYDLLLASGVSRWRAASYYYAVRLFGGKFWDQHTTESVSESRKFAVLIK